MNNLDKEQNEVEYSKYLIEIGGLSYYNIPSNIFVSYLREAEFKIKIKNMSSNENIKDFF